MHQPRHRWVGKHQPSTVFFINSTPVCMAVPKTRAAQRHFPSSASSRTAVAKQNKKRVDLPRHPLPFAPVRGSHDLACKLLDLWCSQLEVQGGDGGDGSRPQADEQRVRGQRSDGTHGRGMYCGTLPAPTCGQQNNPIPPLSPPPGPSASVLFPAARLPPDWGPRRSVPSSFVLASVWAVLQPADWRLRRRQVRGTWGAVVDESLSRCFACPLPPTCFVPSVGRAALGSASCPRPPSMEFMHPSYVAKRLA